MTLPHGNCVNALVTAYNALVTAYNALVTAYNALVTAYNALVTAYNALVTAYNALVTAYNALVTACDALAPRTLGDTYTMPADTPPTDIPPTATHGEDLHPYLAVPAPVAIAHRGGAGLWPQNTMTAFAGAVGLGYRYLETDVQATADNKLVVFHDPKLNPVTDSTGVIAEMTWSEVSQAKIGGTEPIPRLEELLDAWPDMRICIDPKIDATVPLLIKALRRPGVLDRVCLGSFSSARLTRLDEEFGKAVCLSMGPKQILNFRLASLLGSARKAGTRKAGEPRRFRANTLQIPRLHGMVPLATKRVVRFAHAHGIAVHVWTIDDAQVMNQLLDKGVDGIMTDQPIVLRDVLAARGAWPEDLDQN